MTQETIEFTDRYQALGIPYPDPETMCKGQCEGTGWYPTYRPLGYARKDVVLVDSARIPDPDEAPTVAPSGKCSPVGVSDNPVDIALWTEAHRKGCSLWGRINRVVRYRLRWSCDGWHFVKCPDCGGSGKRTGDDQ